MAQYKTEELHGHLKQVVSLDRYNHTLRVIDAAIYLAKLYGENEEDAYIAALLHDYAKEYSKEELMEYIKLNNIEIDNIMKNVYQLIHGKVAAHIALNQFNISNKNILNAIEYHTTGREKMSKLEKIIYLADIIELGRDCPGVDELRILVEDDLNKALVQAFDNILTRTISMKRVVHINTIKARNYYLRNI